jgi:hypothetical protein
MSVGYESEDIVQLVGHCTPMAGCGKCLVGLFSPRRRATSPKRSTKWLFDGVTDCPEELRRAPVDH